MSMRPLDVVVIANAAALTLLVLNGLLPDGATHKNWKKFEDLLGGTSESALQLLPALSVFILDSPSSVNFAAVGLGSWLLSLALLMGVKSCKDGASATCTKGQLVVYNLGYGMQQVGTSLGVGAILAYMKDMKLE